MKSVQMMIKEELTREIVNGDLPAGTRLLQGELAERFRVSISPVREALRELRAEGLVDIDLFTSATVHTPSLKALHEIYEIRGALEPLTVPREPFELPGEILERGRALVGQMDQPLERASWTAANRAFHHLLHSACENQLLALVLTRLENLSDVYVNLSIERRNTANSEHLAMLNAYADGDGRGAASLITEHLTNTLRACIEVLTDRPAVDRLSGSR